MAGPPDTSVEHGYADEFGYPFPDFEQQTARYEPLPADLQQKEGSLAELRFPSPGGVFQRKPRLRLSVVASSCLAAAVQAGNVNIVKLLLENGADVNVLLTKKSLKVYDGKEVSVH